MALTTERPTEPELPDVRPPSTIYAAQSARNAHPRSVVGKLTGVLVQPVTFFRSMPANTNRHFLWIALLTLVLISASAVQQTTASSSGASGDPGLVGGDGTPILPGGPPGVIKPFGGGGSGGGGGGFPGEGGIPPDGGQGAPTGPTIPVSEVWTTVLLACAGVIALWLTQTVLLSEVSLFNAMAPNWGRNFQIAVWASLPLGLMGGIQLLYQSAGGQLGQPGLSGLVDLVPGYANMSEPAQQALTGLLSHFTLFGLWSLLLLYFGARYGLNGKRLTSLLVVTLWVVVIAFAPVAFESLKAARRAARNPVVNDTVNDAVNDAGSNIGSEAGSDIGGAGGANGGNDGMIPDLTEQVPTPNSMVDPQSPVEQEPPK